MTQGRKVIWQEVKSEQRLVFGLAWLAMLALTIPAFTAGYWQCLAWMDLDPSVPLRDQPGRFGFLLLGVVLIGVWLLVVSLLTRAVLAVVLRWQGKIDREDQCELMAFRYPRSWRDDGADQR